VVIIRTGAGPTNSGILVRTSRHRGPRQRPAGAGPLAASECGGGRAARWEFYNHLGAPGAVNHVGQAPVALYIVNQFGMALLYGRVLRLTA
jgi:hypothetical protein